MDNYFITQFKETFTELNTILIQSFINIFGENNKDKIINRINNINFVLFTQNLSFEEIEKKLNYYKIKIEEIKHKYIVYEDIDGNKKIEKDGISENEYLALNELCYQYNYYLNMKLFKKNNTDDSILMYMNAPNYNDDFYEFVETNIKENKNFGGLCTFDINKEHINIMLKPEDDNKINMHFYIHEIIHGLMHENLLIYKDEIINTDGSINDSSMYEIVNEIFVEYISLTIYLDVLKNNTINNLIINTEFKRSLYLSIDEVCNFFLEKTFLKLKDIILTEVINGGTNKIKKIIGVDTLKKIESYLDSIINKFLKMYEENGYEDIFDENDIKEMHDFGKNIFIEIDNNYKEYLEVCKLEDKYVDKLEKQGLVRKV